MRGGGASSSRRVSSPGSAARALETAEERLREALADGLARVSFKINWLIFDFVLQWEELEAALAEERASF